MSDTAASPDRSADATVVRAEASRHLAVEVSGLDIDVLTDEGWVAAVRDVDFDIAAGETVGLVGESGSGKTLTSLAVLGLLDPRSVRMSAGSICVDGVDLASLAERDLRAMRGPVVSMVFQEPMTSLNPAFTVGEQIAESARRHLGMSRREGRAHAVEMLDLVRIPDAARRARSYPHEFSGGMRQRVMIAIALACRPSLLIADEPTTALDVTVQAQVLDLMKDIQDELGMAMLFVTHDLGVIASVADRVVVMYAGQVVERAASAELFGEPRHPYTDALLRSNVAVAGDSLTSIPGRPPAVGTFPEHCHFADRCELVAPECRRAPVPLFEVGPGRQSRCRRIDALEERR